jgi:undecaprenyl-phosphate galactose phosphotransferase
MDSTTTWITDVWNPPRRMIRTRHIRYWISVFGLALADGLAFLFADLLLRKGHSVPAIVIFMGSNTGRLSSPVSVFALLAMIFIVVRYLTGDYGRRQLFWDGAKVTTIALLITSLPDIGMLMLGNGVYQTMPVVLSWVALLFLVPVMRQGMRIVMSRAGIWQIPTAMIGTGPRSEEIFTALQGSLSLGFDLRWLVIEDPETSPPAGLSLLKPIHSADPARTANIVCSEGCKEVVVASEDMQSAHFAEVVQRLLEVNVPVAIVPSINRLPLANATTNYFFGSDILLMQVRSNVQRLPSRIAKRLFDILVSLFLLVTLAPLFVILGIIIKRSSTGPVTYSQVRIGRHGVPFPCIKFRTMVEDADAVLKCWAAEHPEMWAAYLKTYKLRDDPRITRIGKWLRKTSLDELPQLWNVLRGDMSLVGPRPVLARELQEHYGPATQLYIRTRPGMTGLWQVSGRSDTSYQRRVFLDEWYILNWSFWYDIVILIQTAWIVVSGKGAF